jgi:DNA mismatch repair protein MutS
MRVDEQLTEPELARSLGELERDAASLPAAVRMACGRALRYARRCTPGVPLPVRAIGTWAPSQTVALDANAQRHLELVESNVGNKEATLLGVLDLTDSPAGARLLRRRLLAPLLDLELIEARLDAVQVLVENTERRQELKRWLARLGDLERLVTRVALGEGSPKDLGAIRDGLVAAAGAARQLSLLPASQRERLQPGELEVLPDLCTRLSAALVERPPALNKEGAIFRDDYDPKLSQLAHIRREGAGLIVALEARLREETSISGLKARHTRVFGWYLEVSRSSLGKVPKSWRRKQTIAGGERFTSDELDELAHSVASAEDEHRQCELELLAQLYREVSQGADAIHRLCERLAHLDVCAALAEAAHRYEYTRPVLTPQRVLHIEEGRHPVVERLAAAGSFVPNDVHLEQDEARFWIITGPNMAGKSTFLRQVALITLMAQLGSFVPARKATIGLVDRVLSRVGASDNLAQGESTFMVEMRETAEILRHATPRSLVILDEIGRGTSTFDGLSIAWAVAEHLDTVCRSRALFATHYHELTALAEQSQFIDNYSVSAREQDSDIVFLHRLTRGPASQSYGVAVAKLAGLPESVVGRAQALLNSFEGRAESDTQSSAPARLSATKGRRANRDQLSLFGANERAEGQAVQVAPQTQTAAAERAVIDVLRQTDPNRLAPLQALALLAELKSKL